MEDRTHLVFHNWDGGMGVLLTLICTSFFRSKDQNDYKISDLITGAKTPDERKKC